MGKIHSIETFGTVDGPGVRFVVFFQGCPMRCAYCHNPDTWEMDGGTEVSAEELIVRLNRNRAFYKTGGITATGGEPLMQIDFLIELFELAKKEGINTCLDTSGILFPMEQIDRLLAVTDLVMLDIKHIRDEEHRALTGHSNANVLAFARYLAGKNIPVRIRHVVVPGITFEERELLELGSFIGTLPNLEKLEVLPYHSMGKVKYDSLGIDYRLKDTPQLTKAEAKEAEKLIYRGMREKDE